MPAAAAENARTTRARARLAAAQAAEDANPTKANGLAVDRALAQLNAALGPSTLGRITAPANVGDTEPNNTAATATPLNFATNPAATASASINPPGDVDYFSFTAPANARLWGYVDTGGTQNAGATTRDSLLQFIGTDTTTVLEEDDDDGAGNGLDGTQESTLSSSIAYLAGPPAGGTVYARISAVDAIPLDQIINPYTLYVVTTTSEASEVEPNDSFVTANALFNGVPHVGVRTGAISAVTDVNDFYSISANAGDVLYLSLDGDPPRDGSSEDFELELLSTDGSTILFTANSDSGEPLSEGFAFQVAAAGTYYVRVFDNGNTESGTYAVMVANTSQNLPVELQRFEVD
jgi:hypothetical protein